MIVSTLFFYWFFVILVCIFVIFINKFDEFVDELLMIMGDFELLDMVLDIFIKLLLEFDEDGSDILVLFCWNKLLLDMFVDKEDWLIDIEDKFLNCKDIFVILLLILLINKLLLIVLLTDTIFLDELLFVTLIIEVLVLVKLLLLLFVVLLTNDIVLDALLLLELLIAIILSLFMVFDWLLIW